MTTERVHSLAERVEIVHSIIQPKAAPAPWFREELLRRGDVQVSLRTVYRWLEAGNAPEEQLWMVEAVLLTLAHEAADKLMGQMERLQRSWFTPGTWEAMR